MAKALQLRKVSATLIMIPKVRLTRITIALSMIDGVIDLKTFVNRND